MRTILLTLFGVWAMHAAAAAPNYVLIFCDDLGYGDLGCYGSTKNRTPRIDAMAKEGMRFTSFLSSSPVCTPSRASLLTGCYARRVGMHEDFTGHWVLIPRSRRGMRADELTLPEMLKSKGYATACIGKWHLGDQPPHLPTAHGFDEYYGIPYSNDMASARRGDPPLPLIQDTKVIEAPANQVTLTKRYTREAIQFIERNKSKPFFLYLPHTFPHLPLFASREFHGKSANGRYGDSVEEIDWSTGKILDALKHHGLDKNTLVIFTSDNGSNGRNGGSNAPLSGAKGGTMEGGMRVPLIVAGESLPQQGVLSDAFTFVTDITPTILSFAGVKPPDRRYGGRPVEAMIGRDLSPVLVGNAERVYGADDAVGYELAGNAALFQGDYKIVVNRKPLGDGEWRLFNIKKDPGETRDLAQEEPARLQQMLSAYERYQRENKVLEMPPGYGHIKQLLINTLHQQWRTPLLVGLLTLLILLPFLVAYRIRRKP